MSPDSTSRQCRFAFEVPTSAGNATLPVNVGSFMALMIAARVAAVARCGSASFRGVPSLLIEVLFACWSAFHQAVWLTRPRFAFFELGSGSMSLPPPLDPGLDSLAI